MTFINPLLYLGAFPLMLLFLFIAFALITCLLFAAKHFRIQAVSSNHLE